MRQLEPAASVVPQAFAPVETAKSAGLVPVMVMPGMFSVALPEFVSVALCAALVVPTVAVKVGGERADNEATGAATTAPKLAVTLCGALMVMVVASLLAEATLPVQFVNENPVLAVAVRLTTVPGA